VKCAIPEEDLFMWRGTTPFFSKGTLLQCFEISDLLFSGVLRWIGVKEEEGRNLHRATARN
jgi:hypothetical protein